MVTPHRRDLERAVEESMDLFKRARVKPAAPLSPQRPRQLLVAVDGSSQDRAALAAAADLHRRFACQVALVDARENDSSNALAVQAAEVVPGQIVPKQDGPSYEQILAAAGRTSADLLMVPCPYGRDLQSVGPNSAGTVIDVLLARAPAPLLVIRRPFDQPGRVFRHVRMVLTAENEAAPAAAAWGAGLLISGGTFELVLVMEKEMYENLQALIETLAPELELSPESMSEALAHAHMHLHRSLQKTASQQSFEYRLRLMLESEEAPPAEDAAPGLLRLLALERSDHSSQGNVQSRIRLSPDPLLVVCRD